MKGIENWPTVQVLIDNDLYEDYEFSDEYGQVTVPIDLIEGEHILTIEKIGRIDEKDPHSVTITEICIDDVPLPEHFVYNGIFKFNDVALPKATTFEPNGVWSWKFESPIVDWALKEGLKLSLGEDQFLEYERIRQKAIDEIDEFLKELDNDSKV